jgi:hypothetical protein
LKTDYINKVLKDETASLLQYGLLAFDLDAMSPSISAYLYPTKNSSCFCFTYLKRFCLKAFYAESFATDSMVSKTVKLLQVVILIGII